MKVERFVTGILSTNTYLIQNEETKEAVIIDPAACPDYFLGHLRREELKVCAVLLTHGHFDHIMGLPDLLKEYDVPVYVHEAEAGLIQDERLNESRTYTPGYTFSDAVYIKDGDVLKLAGFEFQVLYTPGHTSGGVCYYVADEQVLFSGDTLFQSSIGRTDFPTSSMKDLICSVQEKLMILPEETIVHPGHMGATTIGKEKATNPFL